MQDGERLGPVRQHRHVDAAQREEAPLDERPPGKGQKPGEGQGAYGDPGPSGGAAERFTQPQFFFFNATVTVVFSGLALVFAAGF